MVIAFRNKLDAKKNKGNSNNINNLIVTNTTTTSTATTTKLSSNKEEEETLNYRSVQCTRCGERSLKFLFSKFVFLLHCFFDIL